MLKSTLLAVVLIAALFYFNEAKQTETLMNRPNYHLSKDLSKALEDLAVEMQVIGVEGYGSKPDGTAIKEFWHKTIGKVREIPLYVKTSLKAVPNKFKDILIKEWLKEKEEFEKKWNLTESSVLNAIVEVITAAKKLVGDVGSQLEEFEKKHLISSTEHKVKDDWNKAKESMKSKLSKINGQLEADISKFSVDTSSFLTDVRHHLNHRPHTPILSCGSCHRTFTINEFLELVKNRGYFLKEEDWWTDEELEEFYEGWSEWANRSAVHCPTCNNVNWNPVFFVSHDETLNLKQEL